MGLKKYEIITVGSDKRVRALRSWQVGDRYVNIGDVGGIVYDEKTLSQDGACWLFRGNFNFPGARIGGDSIVDVGETTLSAAGAPNVDILGSSVVVGSKLRFESVQTAEDAVVLTEADFEQGDYTFAAGAKSENQKTNSLSVVRIKSPIFVGGVSKTLKLDVPGYAVQAFGLDADLVMVSATANTITGEGVTLTVPAAQYCLIRLRKDPVAATAPADAAEAQITFTGTYETKLSIVDSRVEVNPATSAGTLTLRTGGTYTITSGAKYPDSVIQNSKVSMMTAAIGNRVITLMAEFIDTSAAIDASVELAPAIPGIYKNVKNLAFPGSVTGDASVSSHGVIQATDCNDFAASATIFPGLAAALSANMPFIFQGCNVPNGRFYHHAQIANTYRDINFDLATKDLGKTFSTNRTLGSSEVNGMYRAIFNGTPGPLIESYASVKDLVVTQNLKMYGTTIYKDAYFNGAFDIQGTNVFGNTKKHDQVQPIRIEGRAMQGLLDTTTVGEKVTGVREANDRVSVMVPIRVGGANAISVQAPDTIESFTVFVDAKNVITVTPGWRAGNYTIEGASSQFVRSADKVCFVFRRKGGGLLKPEDLKDVSVVEYHGCRIINTKATAAVIAGNVRVEDNATLIDVSVTGTGYFGGNSIIQAPSALVGQLPVEGAAYMSDNAVFAPSVANASGGLSLLEMKDNAVFAGQLTEASPNYNIRMSDNARFLGVQGSLREFIMEDNSYVAEGGVVAPTCRGLLIMGDDARIELGVLTAIGCITLRGKYNQTAAKTWTGKRVIDNANAPEYDNNVKTQYDF